MKVKNLLGLLIALFLFGACATYNNARKYYDKHPQAFARDCAGSYVATDSIGKTIIQYVPGINIDYSADIDSLGKQANALNEQLLGDSVKAAQVSKDCANIVSAYQSKVKLLTGQIMALNENYKKRTPDTLKIEVPTFRVPMQTIALLKYQQLKIDSLTNVVSRNEGEIATINKASKTKTYWIIALSIALLAGVIAKFKNLI